MLQQRIEKMYLDPEYKQTLQWSMEPLEMSTPLSIVKFRQEKALVMSAYQAWQHCQHVKSEIDHKADDSCGCKYDFDQFRENCPWSVNAIKELFMQQQRLAKRSGLLRELPDKGAKILQGVQEIESLYEFLCIQFKQDEHLVPE